MYTLSTSQVHIGTGISTVQMGVKFEILSLYSSKSADEEENDMPREVIPKATINTGRVIDSSLNLTNLNVSFNSSSMAEAKRRLEESRTQALLVKSFAYKDNEANPELSIKVSSKEVSEPEAHQEDEYNDSSRASELYDR